MFLRTTRLRQFEENAKNWKKENKKKRLSPKAKNYLLTRLSPTSLINCMYRLRIRSNYIDADSYLLSDISISNSEIFHNSLLAILWYVLTNIEILIRKYIGNRQFDNIVGEFIRNDSTDLSRNTIGLRNTLYNRL